MARFLNRYPKLVRGVDWQGTLDEFAAVIFEEMDYIQEGRNAEVFRDELPAMAGGPRPADLLVALSSPRVLTMEFIEGTKLLDLAGASASGESIRRRSSDWSPEPTSSSCSKMATSTPIRTRAICGSCLTGGSPSSILAWSAASHRSCRG
jgi:hypothetical protein